MNENLTPWERQCLHEATRMSLEAVKEWLPTAAKIRKPGTNEEQSLTDDMRADHLQKIDEALVTLSGLAKDAYDPQDMWAAGHTEVLYGCLEFYGEYIHNMLGFIATMYRSSFEQKHGMTPEELMQKQQAALEEQAREQQAAAELLRQEE